MATDFKSLLHHARSELLEIEERIERLEAERERLNVVIGYLVDKVDYHETSEESPAAAASGPFSDLTIVESAERWLSEVGPPHRDTNEVISGLEAGGFKSEAKSVYTSVYGTLNREAAKDESKLEKKDGKWGLRAWKQPAFDLEKGDSEKEEQHDEERPHVAALPSLGR